MTDYTIDRFEGETAILLDFETGGKQLLISRSQLPQEAAEWNVLTTDGQTFTLDSEKTAQDLAEAQALLESVTHGR
ncbi:DUF3006 domain-containing protein [Eubacterium aggregans]|uniref:DUF3006 domain-containing protein n=1 Tax=Eubacterium aggregans TaxID=81409 RepID=UPI003F31B46B